MFDVNSDMWRAQALGNRRRRNNVGADEIAQAIHRMVDAMQPIVAQPRVVVAPTRPMSILDFMRHKPSKFMAKSTPDEVDAWLKKCEKICRVIKCTDAQRLTFITFLLVGGHAATHVNPGRGGYLDFFPGEILGKVFSRRCQARERDRIPNVPAEEPDCVGIHRQI